MGRSTRQVTTKAIEALNNTINPTGIYRPLKLSDNRVYVLLKYILQATKTMGYTHINTTRINK